MWYQESVFYHVYPLGLCGAPAQNDGRIVHRLDALAGWIPHISRLGAGAVLFGPLWQSDTHGYDTRDYRTLDGRLGSDDDLVRLVAQLHQAGLRVVVDGVFNHVGRGFWAFRDVLARRQASPYAGWFYIDFGRDDNYGDGLWYQGWQDHYELVRLNLANPAVADYLLGCVADWIDRFGIDGLRLDVAYMLDVGFMRRLAGMCRGKRPDFFMVGEMLGGDYNVLMKDGLLDSVTNYECYKGLYSSLNTHNLFEIAYAFNRQSGPEPWCLYRGRHLFNFVDNHDVTRIASQLNDPDDLPLVYDLLMAMPGIPCIYYGSEWGTAGVKRSDGDASLRPSFGKPEWNALTDHLSRLSHVRVKAPALCQGDYRPLLVTNRQLVFARQAAGQRIIVAINTDSQRFQAHFDAQAGAGTDLLTGLGHDFGGGSWLEGRTAYLWQV